jgi:chromatin remodeling complex protein RSC6
MCYNQAINSKHLKLLIEEQKNIMLATKVSAFMKPMTISADLAAVVGKGPMPRSEVVKALWVYIKKNNLQDPKAKRNIVADDNLKKVFGGKGVVNMFEMTKLVSKHLS